VPRDGCISRPANNRTRLLAGNASKLDPNCEGGDTSRIDLQALQNVNLVLRTRAVDSIAWQDME